MTTMKPCPKCHSTEHLHIEIIDDNLTATRSVKVGCTECHTFAQLDYVFTGSFANERRPDDVQLTREGFECSVCGCRVEDEEHYHVSGTWNFCPRCGRKVVNHAH